MKKENMRIKENITISDQINVINYIMDYYFTDGEYTPYYAGIGKIEAIALYLIDGVEFDDDEYVYECVENDKELRALVHKFCYDVANGSVAKKHNTDNRKYIDVMRFVIENVNEKLEFEKQKRIHCTDEKSEFISSISNFVNDLDSAMSNFSNLKLSELTPDMIEKAKNIIDQLSDKEITADVVSDVIKNAVDFKVDESEIVDGLKSQIGNLCDLLRDERKKNKTLEKKVADFGARNVLADK